MAKNKNDFFNLESSSDDEEDDKLNQAELDKKIRKWDWDRPENFNLYSKYEQKSSNKKVSLVSGDYSDEESEKNNSKKLCLFKKPDSKPVNNYIEKFETISNKSNQLMYNLNGHQSSVNRIHWSKKQSNILLSSSMDSKVIIWNLEENKNESINKIRVYSDLHTKSIRNSVWSLYETEILTASYDQTSVLLDITTGKQKNKFKHSDILTAVCVHPMNENLIQLGSKNFIFTWDTRETNNKAANTYKSKSSYGLVQDILFLNDTDFISSGDVVSKDSAEYSIIAWDFRTRVPISNQIFHEKFICTCLKKHPFNSLFYAQTHGNYIAEFSSRSPFKMNKSKRFESIGHSTQGYSIGFDLNATGSMLASGSRDGSIYIYSSITSKLSNKIDAFSKDIIQQPCLDAKFQPNNTSIKETLAASSLNGQIKIFSI